MTDTIEPSARGGRPRREPLRAEPVAGAPVPAPPADAADALPEGEHFRLGFRPALDGLRGVSVLAIMVFHTVTYLLPPEHQDLAIGTFLSVDVFFVLSGFLITSLLLEERARTGATSLRAFYGRRALRLLPAVGALLIGTTLYVVATGLDLWVHLRTSAMIASYTSNWFFGRNAEITDGMGHMWTLAIEEQFYIVWPLVLIAVLGATAARHGRRVLAALLVGGIGVSVAARFLLWESSEIWSRVYFRTDARMDAILVGCLIAVACHQGWLRARPRPWLAVGAAAGLGWLFWWAIPYSSWYYQGGATISALVIGALLLATLVPAGPVGRALTSVPLRYAGRISYSLYLWHVPVYAAALRYLGDDPLLVRLAVAEALTLALGMASHHLVERPFLRLKARFNTAGHDPVVAAPGVLTPEVQRG